MTPSTLAEPVCPGAVGGLDSTPAARNLEPDIEPPVRARLLASRCPIGAISAETWDRLRGLNPWATPFSSWAFQRAWWDAYGANAEDETIVVLPADEAGRVVAGADPVGIMPLMHRHEVEPADEASHSRMRHSAEVERTAVPDRATAIFFGASYHADYASLLTAPRDLGPVSEAVATTSPDPAGRAGMSSTCAGCAAATLLRRPWRPPSGGSRRSAAGPSTSSARTSARS